MVAEQHLYLASGSPRRRELLEQLGVKFEIIKVAVDESRLANETPLAMVVRLASAKAAHGRALAANNLPVLAADTIVAKGNEVFGKPRSRAEGLVMLATLSGTTHEVFTGIALDVDGRQLTRTSVTRVQFRTIDSAEAEAYWASGEPADKAGSYAIQGLGGVFISHIEGSYSGVVGLPVFETAELLRQSGIMLLNAADG